MKVHVNTTKCFIAETSVGADRHLVVAPSDEAQTIPSWCVETATFRQGIKDGSIQPAGKDAIQRVNRVGAHRGKL